MDEIDAPVAVHIPRGGEGTARVNALGGKLAPALVDPQGGAGPDDSFAFVAQVGEHDVLVAIAVQVGRAANVVVWAASIDAVKKIVQVTTPGHQQKQ